MRRVAAVGVVVALAALGYSETRDVARGYSSTSGAHVMHFTIASPLTHRKLHETLVLPTGDSRGRELLIFLHGRSATPDSNLQQPFFDEIERLGARAPVVLFADGADHSYWHDRTDGAWGSSVLREVIPAALKRSGADPHRVAIGGISMGGFGALDLARIAPGRFCAVGAHSPALWASGGETAAGAFDDADDFARHDLIAFARAKRLYRMPVAIDIGRDDPFLSATTSFAGELKANGTRLRFSLHPGGHDGWSDRMPNYLRFYVSACPA